MIRLENWALVTRIRKTFVTPQILKKRKIPLMLIGYVTDEKNSGEKKFFKSGRVLMIQNRIVTTINEEIVLGTPSKEYKDFIEAVKKGIPVVINWVIGKDNILSANLYKDGKVSYICQKVKEQDFLNKTLLLENGKTVYVVWQNINEKMLNHLSKIAEWMSVSDLFPTKDCCMQIDVFQASRKIWAYKTIPYEWIIDSPHHFSIFGEEIIENKK